MTGKRKAPAAKAKPKAPSKAETIGADAAPSNPAPLKPETQQDEASTAATPLDYMLSVMRDPAVEPDRRDEMAKLALPYMHPKVTAETGGKDAPPPDPAALSETDVARRIGFVLAKAAQGRSAH